MYEYYENYGHKIASAADELLMKLPETPEPKNVPAKNNDIKPADEPSEPKKRDEKPANEPQFDISYLSDEEAAVYNTIKNSGTAMLADDIAETAHSEENAAAEAVIAAVRALPEKYRPIVEMYYYEEMSCAEIAAALKMNEATVRTRLKRAREKLKKELEVFENE